MSVAASQLFARGGGATYARFRPTYPSAVLDRLAQHVGERRPLAVDLACGTGQLTHALVERGVAERVRGFDVSSDQIEAALASNSNDATVDFAVASATDVPLGDHEVDVLTLAQALVNAD